MTPLNIFYAEPDPDRWLPFDRYPRKLIRRIVRGKARPGGTMIVALNLMEGLKRINYPFRFNDYNYLKSHPSELACVIGKPHLIFEKRITKNPILFGAAVFSHPIECLDFFSLYPNVKKMLVPGKWMEDMCEPYYGNKVLAWPVGIDAEKWKPTMREGKFDFLIYDKVRWEHDHFANELIDPIIAFLRNNGFSYEMIRYGQYNPADFEEKLGRARAMIFLCEHETQGLAYQQALSCDVPILVWDRGGYWQDPSYYPDKVKYQPVSSVPYWDERCGMKFKNLEEFNANIDEFMDSVNKKSFNPRAYILENLTLEKCAEHYLKIVKSVENI